MSSNTVAKWIRYGYVVALGFGAVVEWSHFRQYEKAKNRFRMVTTASAAIACSYMASEALTGDWPAWDNV